LVWIDTRYQRTEQALLNPLAWLPWVGDPGWGNNDVLAAPFSEVLRDSAVAETLQPMRLTKDLSYAEFVRARAEKDRVYVVWSGGARLVRKLRARINTRDLLYDSAVRVGFQLNRSSLSRERVAPSLLTRAVETRHRCPECHPAHNHGENDVPASVPTTKPVHPGGIDSVSRS